jgi:hypothetical protein
MPDDPILARLATISAALRDQRVPHAVIGGLALAAWGPPRATFDIDFLVPGDETTLEAVRTAARTAALDQVRRKVIAFERIRLLRMAAVEGDAVITVDFVIVADEVSSEMLRRVQVARLGENSVPVASPEDIVLLKSLRSSDQDRVDIRGLAEAIVLDRRYLRAAGQKLGVLTELAAAGLVPRPARRPRRRRKR